MKGAKTKLIDYDASLKNMIQRKEILQGKYYRQVQKLQALSEKFQKAEERLEAMKPDDKRHDKLENTVLELGCELELFKENDKWISVSTEWDKLLENIQRETEKVTEIITAKISGLHEYIELLKLEISNNCQANFDENDDDDSEVVPKKQGTKKRPRDDIEDDDDWENEDNNDDSDSDDSSSCSSSSSIDNTDLIKRCKTQLSKSEKIQLVQSLFTKKELITLIK